MQVCFGCKVLVFPDNPAHACDTPRLMPLDTYLKSIRLIAGEPLTISLAGPAGEPKPKRGRPRLRVGNMDAALYALVQGAPARQVAQEMYGVAEPTDRQIRNVYSRLKQYEKSITGGKYPSELYLQRGNLKNSRHTKSKQPRSPSSG